MWSFKNTYKQDRFKYCFKTVSGIFEVVKRGELSYKNILTK